MGIEYKKVSMEVAAAAVVCVCNATPHLQRLQAEAEAQTGVGAGVEAEKAGKYWKAFFVAYLEGQEKKIACCFSA